MSSSIMSLLEIQHKLSYTFQFAEADMLENITYEK